MNNIFTLIILLLSLPVVKAQVVEHVYFNNYTTPSNNDFVNYFDGGAGMIVNLSDGITGGCLEMPNTNNWGNDNALYCSKYLFGAGNLSITRISFKYDTTQINTVNFDRAVSIFLRPSADFNHYVIASVTHDKKIQFLSYSLATNSPSMNLQHNHWYEFTLFAGGIVSNPPYQINLSAIVADLGLTGLSSPVPVDNLNGLFYDSLLFADPAVEVSFSGALWGGGKYLDNFHYSGFKSADSCIISTEISQLEDNPISVVFSENAIQIAHGFSSVTVEVYSTAGTLVSSGIANYGTTDFDIAAIKNGLYILRLQNPATGGNSVDLKRKFSIIRH